MDNLIILLASLANIGSFIFQILDHTQDRRITREEKERLND